MTEQAQPALTPLDAPMVDGQVDMVAEVARTLREAGLGQEVEAHFVASELTELATGKSVDVQRFFMNRYWTQQLGGLQNRTGVSTVEQRFCLIDKGTPESWLKLFQEMILPTAMQHRLPAALA